MEDSDPERPSLGSTLEKKDLLSKMAAEKTARQRERSQGVNMLACDD